MVATATPSKHRCTRDRSPSRWGMGRMAGATALGTRSCRPFPLCDPVPKGTETPIPELRRGFGTCRWDTDSDSEASYGLSPQAKDGLGGAPAPAWPFRGRSSLRAQRGGRTFAGLGWRSAQLCKNPDRGAASRVLECSAWTSFFPPARAISRFTDGGWRLPAGAPWASRIFWAC
jgi:hypothetical protein